MTKYFFGSLIFLILGCKSEKGIDKSYSSENITIDKVTNHVYQHSTYLQTETFGKVSCNGMVVFDGKDAVVFDTPGDDTTAAELIDWVTDSLKCKIIAVIPTHFHDDCLGGLEEFHRRGIPSYALDKTIALAKAKKSPVPQHSFDRILELKVSDRDVIAAFYGEGHTADNIVGYFPSEQVLFGGCLVKELQAGKGNLEDANEDHWSATVLKVKHHYPDVHFVIPGHGASGDSALLDYTIQLFDKK